MRPLLKITLYLLGYVFLSLGSLVAILATKVIVEILPEVFVAQLLGLGLLFIGFWLLGQHNKLSKGRSIWQ